MLLGSHLGHGAQRGALRRRARRPGRARRRPAAEGRGRGADRPLWVVSFNDEEGARFQTGMLGSRAFCGDCDLEDWGRRGVAEAMAAAGFDFARLPTRAGGRGRRLPRAAHRAGPVLERAGVDLGIVTAITGMLGFRARFLGEANHAGTTPMELRRDALAGAARAVLALRDEGARPRRHDRQRGRDLRRAGRLQRRPGAAEITIDVRSPTTEGFARLEPFVREALERIAAEEELGLELRETHRKQPVALDPELQDRLEEAAREEGATTLRLASGAGTTRWCSPTTSRRRCSSSRAAAASATRPTSSRPRSTASWAPACSPGRCGVSSGSARRAGRS